jgi:hypothetical protein
MSDDMETARLYLSERRAVWPRRFDIN